MKIHSILLSLLGVLLPLILIACTLTPIHTPTPPSSSSITTVMPNPNTPPSLTTALPPIITEPSIPEDPIDPAREWIVVDTIEFLNLRTEPSALSTSIQKIYAGESIEVISFTGKFAQARYKGKSGYVHASYITRPKEQGTAKDLTVLNPVANYSYEQMQADLQTLAHKFPAQFSLSSIGTSEKGRDLTLCLLGNPNAEKNILLQASIHGREHVVTQIAVGEIDYILHHQDMILDNDMSVGELLNNVCFHIIPMSNPDGVTIAQTGILPQKFLKKYSKDPDIATNWKANANGIDLNANFDAAWNSYKSEYNSTAPSYAGYKGTSPECAKESIALANYLRSIKFDLTLSYHTSGPLIYWSFEPDKFPTVNQQSKELAQLISEHNGFALGKQDRNSTAGLKDYAMQALGIPSLTIEFSQVNSPAPFSEFELTWARGKDTMLISAQWVLTQ